MLISSLLMLLTLRLRAVGRIAEIEFEMSRTQKNKVR